MLSVVFCLTLAANDSRASAIASYADSLVGKPAPQGGGRNFTLDSVGVVRAAFLQHGIDLFAAPAAVAVDRTGVDVVYQYAALNGRLHLRRRPAVGDLCFFGRTRDLDQDGTPDSITHVGVVTAVAADGTATVVTAGRSKVVAMALNRYRPKDAEDEVGQSLNARMFLASGKGKSLLASEAFYTFATLTN